MRCPHEKTELNSYFTKINSRQITRLKVKAETVRLLEKKKKGRKLFQCKINKGFLGHESNYHKRKAEINL